MTMQATLYREIKAAISQGRMDDSLLRDMKELTTGWPESPEAKEIKRYMDELEAKKTTAERAFKSIILTTESNPDIEITERLEIISAECAFGMNLFRDFFLRCETFSAAEARPHKTS